MRFAICSLRCRPSLPSARLIWPSCCSTRQPSSTSRSDFASAAQSLPKPSETTSASSGSTDSRSPNKHSPQALTVDRDHQSICAQQGLTLNSKYSPGSPIFTPDGAYIFNRLVDLIKNQYQQYGFREVITPTVYKKTLWEQSGHWENYADDMYTVQGRGATGRGAEPEQDEIYGLKPMNCPGHCLIFASKQWSFRDLPVRYADHGALHRNEIHGALSGLTRVRKFHLDDGHIFCRPSQIHEEIGQTLAFIKAIYHVLWLRPYKLVLSTRPTNYIGSIEEWDHAESALRQALDASGQEWTVNEGDGAFYGPKIDIILADADGKEHQTATVQLDFQLPKRFDLKYKAPAPELEQIGESTTNPVLLSRSGPCTPVMIHRAVLGSVERMMAILMERNQGQWPFWLNPRPLAILTVSDDPALVRYAENVRHKLQDTERQVWKQPEDGEPAPKWFQPISYTPMGPIQIDTSPRTLGKKIQEAKRERFAIVAVVGKDDIKKQTVTVDLSGIEMHKVHARMQDHLKQRILRNRLSDWSDERGVWVTDMEFALRQVIAAQEKRTWTLAMEFGGKTGNLNNVREEEDWFLAGMGLFPTSTSTEVGDHPDAVRQTVEYKVKCADLVPEFREALAIVRDDLVELKTSHLRRISMTRRALKTFMLQLYMNHK